MVTPPENVRLVDPLGNEWHCELKYDGEHEDIHNWLATPTHMPTKFGKGWEVKIGILPSQTSITLGVDDD